MSEGRFCDISNHQPSTDAYIKAIKDWGATAVVVKITEGSNFIDQTAAPKIALIKKYGMKVHAYHFFHGQSISDSKSEARYFSAQAEKLGLDKNTTIMANDIEATDLTYNAQALTSYANAFYDEIKALGWKLQDTYSSSSWLKNRLVQSQLKANNFWVASYGAKPDKNFPGVKYGAWQYSSDPASGNIETIGGVITDCNIDYTGFYTTNSPTQDQGQDIPAPQTPGDPDDLKALFDKILNDTMLKMTTIEYCTSIIGYIANGQIYDKPVWL